ncbi:hypothetical protein AVEN_147783-1 [Araneus ventricosus]|uniref:Uncharacterized protein n=1 Tax=Araneus ventricosus TaxID=182803 RepID=A0A4Y2WB18_ARAVE|nr:hypothetical protein AVEN_147783-1 [Araneus ventricosus]
MISSSRFGILRDIQILKSLHSRLLPSNLFLGLGFAAGRFQVQNLIPLKSAVYVDLLHVESYVIKSNLANTDLMGRGGLVVRSRPRDRRVAGSKPDSTEDPPCMGPVAR